ncbi:MarR family winged helix-turn-helix transcriptional regulator [Dactylosporangium darangshiense]|uniref:MarR family winged helix-turn-helix transcriptional regulator n=1 Tax=Dactylosporangium darangshiense TaxID=579108 RepID=UPI0031E68722
MDLAPAPETAAGRSLIPAMVRVAQLAQTYLKKNALTPHALDWNEFLVLRVVAVEPGIRSSRAASRLGMNRATLSGVVSRLEDRDLIRRESVDDGVRVELNLTQTGIEVWRGVSRDAAEAERSFTRAPAGQRTLVALARRIGGLVGPV